MQLVYNMTENQLTNYLKQNFHIADCIWWIINRGSASICSSSSPYQDNSDDDDIGGGGDDDDFVFGNQTGSSFPIGSVSCNKCCLATGSM